MTDTIQKLREALQAISHIDDSTNHAVDASEALDRIGKIARQALALPTADHIPDAGEMVVDHLPDAGKMIETAAPDMPPQLRKIHPLDFPLEVFLADLTTRPAKIIRAEMLSFTRTDGTYDIEPPLTVRHLCMFSRNEMRKWPQMGKKSLNEIEETLRDRGLQLWENHDERSLRLLREHKDYFK